MSERYTRIFKIEENLYMPGSPVIISAGALLKDNVTGKVIAQLKFKNISPKAIKALSVRITPKDTAERVCGGDIEYQYLDINVTRENYFGSKIPVEMPDSHIRAFDVKVSNVIFIDNEVVELPDAIWKPLPRRRNLHEVLGDEMVKQYRIDISSPKGTYIPEKVNDLWICTCGAVNKTDEAVCHSCEISFEKELRTLVDREKLSSNMDARLEKEKAEREERERRTRIEAEQCQKRQEAIHRKWVKVGRIGLTSVIAVVAVIYLLVIPVVNYDQGSDLLGSGAYEAAAKEFEDSKWFKNKGYQKIYDKGVESLDADNYEDAVKAFGQSGSLKGDGDRLMHDKCEELLSNGDNEKAVKLLSVLGSKSKAIKDLVIPNIDYTVQPIVFGDWITTGLKSDGTVVAVGDNDYGQRNVDGWTDIVAIAAGYSHTVGLRSDGTVVTAGSDSDGKRDVGSWTDIVAIAAGNYHTVGLRSDGTVVSTEIVDTSKMIIDMTDLINRGQDDVGGWTDIKAIVAGSMHTVGLKSDGTVVAVGENDEGQCNVDGWTDIVAIAAGNYHTVGLRSDGTVVSTEITDDDYDFSQSDVGAWTDIVAISARDETTVGLKANGTAVAVGYNNRGQCDVDDWTGVVSISAGPFFTAGLKLDGTVVTTGIADAGSDFGQGYVNEWTDIKYPFKVE